MNSIKLNFINESNDQNNSEVVIFQKNVATNFGELAVAWRVIKNCGTQWKHPFEFPMEFAVSACDYNGNEYNGAYPAQNGKLYAVSQGASGNELSTVGDGAGRNEVQLRNDLSVGAIGAEIFKDGKLLATKTGISPGQKAVFEFKPTIWIGVASQVEEGKVINSAILSDINTELELKGIKSADIVMTGGGSDSDATPFVFMLHNIVRA